MTVPCVFHCGREVCVGTNPPHLISTTCDVCWEEGQPNIVVRIGDGIVGLDPSIE